MQRPVLDRFLAAFLVLGLAACGGEGADTGATGDTTAIAPDSAPTPATGALNDAQIAAVLSAADSSEILPSQLAQQQAQSAEVKAYAQRMVTDHGMLEDSLRAMARQTGITPEPSPTSEQLLAATQTTLRQLRGTTGASFDSAYMQAMVQSHQTALTTIDSQLLPSAQSPQLRAALEQKVRPAVQTHLEEAQRIQSSLGAH